MTFPFPSPRCHYCGEPSTTTATAHVCEACQVVRDHEPDATWTAITDCTRGWPACPLGDGHAGDCEVLG